MISKKENHITFLKQEVNNLKIEQQLSNPNVIKNIQEIKNLFISNVCSTIPNAFWTRKKHIVSLPYESNFCEKYIPTKSRAIHMNQEMEKICIKEINDLKSKGLIRDSKSLWSCSAFYVMNAAELERGVPRLVINYKPLNKVLK